MIAEFGIVLPLKVERLRREIGPHLEDLRGYANLSIGDLLSHADQLDARQMLTGSRLGPRRECLISSRGRSPSRLTVEVPVRVFHQGPGNKPNMTGCSFAVLHLLTRHAQWSQNQIMKLK